MTYKGRTDNYPDDIRSYDNDPRSPFYEEPEDSDEALEAAEVRADMEYDRRRDEEQEITDD